MNILTYKGMFLQYQAPACNVLIISAL